MSKKPTLEDQLNTRSQIQHTSKPILLNLAKREDQNKLAQLFKQNKILTVTDDYLEQETELFQINNPQLSGSSQLANAFQHYIAAKSHTQPLWQQGRWAYFPWLHAITHILEDRDFQKVRTARNKNLITTDEQDQLYNATIGIAGLSVGNSVALAIVLQGGGKRIKLADHDRLALSNTNRIRTGVTALGILKIEMTARQIYEINPYAQVELFPEGIFPKNIKKFFKDLDIVIDEIDNLAAKCLIRVEAKKNKIPVIMAADNGDSGVVDIERHDKKGTIPFFHGRLGKVSYQKLLSLDKQATGKMITKLVGPENVGVRMQNSLLEIGNTLVSWPQLGGTALLNGSSVAYCVRKILNNQPLENNRAIISLDSELDPTYLHAQQIRQRSTSATAFKKRFHL